MKKLLIVQTLIFFYLSTRAQEHFNVICGQINEFLIIDVSCTFVNSSDSSLYFFTIGNENVRYGNNYYMLQGFWERLHNVRQHSSNYGLCDFSFSISPFCSVLNFPTDTVRILPGQDITLSQRFFVAKIDNKRKGNYKLKIRLCIFEENEIENYFRSAIILDRFEGQPKRTFDHNLKIRFRKRKNEITTKVLD